MTPLNTTQYIIEQKESEDGMKPKKTGFGSMVGLMGKLGKGRLLQEQGSRLPTEKGSALPINQNTKTINKHTQISFNQNRTMDLMRL